MSNGPLSLALMSRSDDALLTVWAEGVTLVWRELENHANVAAVRASASSTSHTAAPKRRRDTGFEG